MSNRKSQVWPEKKVLGKSFEVRSLWDSHANEQDYLDAKQLESLLLHLQQAESHLYN